jgi:hypothetical protein
MPNDVCVVVKFWNEEQLLPYFLKQWENKPVDIHFYDGGSTDNSINIINDYMKNHRSSTRLSILQPKHDDYLHDCNNSEVKHLNRMRSNNRFYKWIIHIDVDEVLLDIDNVLNSLNCGYFDSWDLLRIHRYNCFKSINKIINWFPGMTLDIMKDYQARIYKPLNVQYIKVDNSDAFCISNDQQLTAYVEIPMLHLKDAMPNRRNQRNEPIGNFVKRWEGATTIDFPYKIPDYLFEIDLESII